MWGPRPTALYPNPRNNDCISKNHREGVIDRVTPGRGPSCPKDGARRLFGIFTIFQMQLS